MNDKVKRLTKAFAVVMGITVGILGASNQGSAAINLKINGKSVKYKKSQAIVKYKGKNISKVKYSGILISNTWMVPYDDVFKKGLKVKTTYSAAKKQIKMSRHGTDIVMKLGSKYATINGVKKKISGAAPAKVRYVSQKKTKVLVPAKFLANKLDFNYKAEKSMITISDALSVEYNGKTAKSSVVADFKFNDQKNVFSTMPVIKLNSSLYIPAEECLKNIMGLEYSYENEKLIVKNEATKTNIEISLGANEYLVNGESVKWSTPMWMVKRKDTGKEVLCVPAKAILKALGFSYRWSKEDNVLYSNTLVYYDWKADSSQYTDTSVNYLSEFSALYNDKVDCISFILKGSNAEIMDKITINRNSKEILITVPATSKYLLDSSMFNGFGSTLDKVEVTQEDNGNVIIKVEAKNTVDFAYTNLDGVLTLNIMKEYSGDFSLKLNKPSGVTIEDLSNQDLYANKKFKIIIKGDHEKFYNENPIVVNSNTVTSVSTSLNSSGNTEILVKTSKLQGYKIFEKDDSFVVNVGNPKSIYKNIVILDAGHGGYDSGATNNGTKEKDLNYKIIYTLMKDYFSSNAPDIKAYWTRTTDTFITLANRAAYASKMDGDIFISLHMNSASNSSANGTEVYYSPDNNKTSFSGINSKAMASILKNNLIATLGTKSRGVKTAGYYVNKHNTVPAILIELGFISGSTDYSKLTNLTFQKNATKVIYDSIVEIFTKYPTGR